MSTVVSDHGQGEVDEDPALEPAPGSTPEHAEILAASDQDDASAQTRGSIGGLALIVGGVAALMSAVPISDNSFLTHLATGRIILDSGLPTSNPFLYSSTSFPVPSYWWSITLGVVDKIGGASALRLLTAVLAGLLGALLVRMAAGAKGRGFLGETRAPGLLAVIVPSALALMCVFQFLSGRPHLIGFVLLAMTVVVWKERRSPWWLVPIFMVWVNVHGSWLYGLIVVGMFVVAEAVDRRAVIWRQAAMIGTAVLGTVIGGALYPDRFAVMLLPTRQFGDPTERAALQLYREWGRVGPTDPMFWMLIGIAMLALFGCVRQRRWGSTAVVVLLVVMGLSGLRLVPIAAVALVPFAALGLSGIGTLALPTGRRAVLTTGLGALICAGAVGFCFVGPNYDLGGFPVKATDWLEERDLVGNETKVVSHDYVGNYLEWRFGDRANTWVDDRPAAETLLDLSELQRLDPEWRHALARANGDVVIWTSKGKLTKALKKDPDWVVGTSTGGYTVFCRAELADRCS